MRRRGGRPLARRVGGGIAGVFAGALAYALVRWAGHKLYPLPQPMEIADAATAGEAMEHAPAAALLVIVTSWIAAALVGGFVARRIGGPGWPALAVAGTVLLGVVVAVSSFPHPGWMVASGIAGVAAAGWVTSRLPVGERPLDG